MMKKTENGLEAQTEECTPLVPLHQIFIVFLKIGAFTFGGGYVMLPIIQRELVSCKNWLESEEFYDILVLIQGLPGPVALNCALLTARKMRGMVGGVVAATGVILPSLIIIISIAAFLFPVIRGTYYVEAAFYGIRPAVTALVAAAAINMGRDLIRDKFGLFLLIILFFAGWWIGIHPIFLLLVGGFTGWIYYYHYREGDGE